MKRILFLADNLCSGGAERQMVAVARLLKSKGYDVNVYCYEQNNFYAHFLEELKIPIIWEIEQNYFKRAIKVRKHIRKGRYDAVVSFLPTCNFLNDFAALGGKKWKVITGERSSRDSTFLSIRGKVFCKFQKFTDFIVCNSNNAKDKWIKYKPQYQDKLRVVYNYVTMQAISTSYLPKREEKLHIIVAATYQYLKNPIGLINAVLLMSEQERSCFVVDWYGRQEVTRGNTKVFDETARLVKENHLESVLQLHSDTPNIANKMHEADVVMLLSQFEGLPNVICEGMTLGKPIIMTRVSDFANLVDENNGMLCEADQPDSIKAAILAMVDKSIDELQKMGEASKAKASKLFSAEKVTQQWEALI